MRLNLHANARTTPNTRAGIQRSAGSVRELAAELGVSETTVRRWKGRTEVHDRSHVRHDLGQSTTAEEEALIRVLRRDLRLSLDDLLEVMRRTVKPELSRSALARRLRRLGLNVLPKEADATATQRFDETPFGYVHLDLKHLTRLRGQPSYAFVAIERATRFVHVELIMARDSKTVTACLERFLKAFGHPVHTILTDNGGEFTDRFATGEDRPPTGKHPIDRLCARHGIKHRLTRPFRPQTNGMVERFNRRLAEAMRRHKAAQRNGGKNKFDSHAERNAFIATVVDNYNRTRLRCLGYHAPIEALLNQAEHNTCAGIAGRMELEEVEHRVSAESIYRHVYSPAGRHAGLPRQLAQRKAKRGRRRRNGRREPSIPNRVPIHQRPTKAHLRSEFGRWEGDLMHFRRQRDILLTLQERRSRLTLARRLSGDPSTGRPAFPPHSQQGRGADSQRHRRRAGRPGAEGPPNHHPRQWRGVRPASGRDRSDRPARILLRPAQPLAARLHRERQRPPAPRASPKDQPWRLHR